MKVVNSFDIFDTLLARTVENPTDIFDIVEKKFPFPDFKRLRQQAQDNSNQTIQDIYHQFKLITGETDERIEKVRTFELHTEMENTIPIMSNILKIKDGDIFVSDMYLSRDDIRQLLNYHKINPNTSLYVSKSGKASGCMYENLLQEYKIESHTGDNYHSDITMASRYNIPGVFTEIHTFSPLEKEMIHTNFELSNLFRKFRLMNPHDENSLEYKIYDQQIKYNIPLLLFMCKQLESILIKENRKRVLFLSRDGCLIYKLFSAFYPQYDSVYLHSSRIMNHHYNDDYVSYLKNIYNEDDCLLFDLHGSFNSGRRLFTEIFGHLPRIYIFHLSKENAPHDRITYMTDIHYEYNKIESLNQDKAGSLVDFKNGNPIRMPCESQIKYVNIMHSTVENFVNFSKNDILLVKDTFFENVPFWKNYYDNFVRNSDVVLDNSFFHWNNTLTNLANSHNSDKGNTYHCAHHYTIKYQEIISDLLKTRKSLDNIDLLEIGLNRSDSSSIPSIMMWNEYFYKNINITGFDIHPRFLEHNGKFPNIQISIGDQSNEMDLHQLKKKEYDIIIDDGFHASEHQQISFKTLWSNVKSGGYYIIEDLHYQPIHETCTKTRTLFENWKNGMWMESEYIYADEIEYIRREIQSIDFCDSFSKNWGDSVKNALVYIRKN